MTENRGHSERQEVVERSLTTCLRRSTRGTCPPAPLMSTSTPSELSSVTSFPTASAPSVVVPETAVTQAPHRSIESHASPLPRPSKACWCPVMSD